MSALTERYYPLGRPSHPDNDIDTQYERMVQVWGREVMENPIIFFNQWWHTAIGYPTKDPRDIDHYERRDGNLKFILQRGFLTHPKSGQTIKQGYPFGVWPRRLQLVINTLILRGNGNRKIYVGNDFKRFLENTLPGSVALTTGKNGSVPRVKEQFMRMSSALHGYHIIQGKVGGFYNPAPMIEASGVYFDDNDYWPQMIVVSKDYRDSLCTAAVPVDMRAVLELDGSFEHDLYSWLTRRVFAIRNDTKPAFIPWSALKDQFGRNYAEIRMFRRDFLIATKHIAKTVYRDLRITEAKGGIHLWPSRPPVDQRFFAGYTDPTAQGNLFGNDGVDTSRVISTTIEAKKTL